MLANKTYFHLCSASSYSLAKISYFAAFIKRICNTIFQSQNFYNLSLTYKLEGQIHLIAKSIAKQLHYFLQYAAIIQMAAKAYITSVPIVGIQSFIE